MIPLAVPNLCGNEKKYLANCIDTTFVSTVGEYVNKFEDLISEETNAKGTVCVNTGTAALHASLKCLGVEHDSLVILPSLTFIASANAIRYLGASPWLMDITEESWTLDPTILRKELEEKTHLKNGKLYHRELNKVVSCIMPVYTLGCPADMDPIAAIAKEFNLPIVADAAAAIGSSYKSSSLAELATFTTFSFNGNKTITSGGGGAIISNNKDLLKKARHLTTTARVGANYYHDEVGFNYRMTNIEAAVGCAQIENLKYFVDKKREIQQFYKEELNSINGVSFFPEPKWAKSSSWFSGIVFENLDEQKMQKLIKEFAIEGVMIRPFWMPIHLQPQFKDCIKSNLEYSESLWKKIIVLPCSTNITQAELEKVSSTVKKLLG